MHENLITGVAPTLDTFLDRAAMQVDNYTANEANKIYGLVLAALFERQIRIWAVHLLDHIPRPKIESMKFRRLLAVISAKAHIDLKERDMGTLLVEAFLVANVVRHGDGSSLKALRLHARKLWDQSKGGYIDLLAGPPTQSELLRIRPGDLERYVEAMIWFWGRADPQPLAVTEYRIKA